MSSRIVRVNASSLALKAFCASLSLADWMLDQSLVFKMLLPLTNIHL